ncbi:unnamed protein product [Peronospora destructor]|uniref:FH2 domain-containing protein n=1 Tax=Peronospora destructor TaxID=86335 RepID=A0AAV0V4Q9_9STRA|nr:unnamed protein product [Peronospora destructor]
MAPSFISTLMADKRSNFDSITAGSTTRESSGVTLPHLMRSRSSRSKGLQFGLPGFQRVPFGQTHSRVTSMPVNSAHWNDRQKMQDFFRHTTDNPDDEKGDIKKSDNATEDKKAVQSDDKMIDVRELVARNAESSETSSTSSEENQQDEWQGTGAGQGRLQSALEDLLARQQAEEQQIDDEFVLFEKRRRYDSFDVLADVRIDDEDSDSQMEAVDSLYSTPTRSRKSSEEFFGGGLLEMLSQRHMPVGVDRHASVADMLVNRAFITPKEHSDEDRQEHESTLLKLEERSWEVTKTGTLRTETSTTDRSNMQGEVLAKRAASSTGSDCLNKPPANKDNALEAMLSKRASPSPMSPSKGSLQTSKANPLEAMLARRNAPSPLASEVAQDELSGAAHPLAATLKSRHHKSAASAEAVPLGNCDSTETDQTPLKNHPAYQKYFKMLAVGLPVPVVKQKMQSESVDPTILDMDPNKPLPEAAVPALDKESEAAYQAQLKEYEAKHGKYVQMVKVGLPSSVVEHKMRMDGVDPVWLQGPPNRPEPKAAAATEVKEEKRAAHRKTYRKYFQMLRMGLPRGAVEQKMRMAGLDPAELNGPRPVATPAEQPKKALKRKNSIRKKLHWEGKKNGTRRDSLWGSDAMEEAKEQVQISEESRAMLEKLFVKDLSDSKKRNASAKSEGAAVATKKKAMVQLIDSKKSQNIAITLARVKLTYSELKREILTMNATVLSCSQMRSLMDMWPDRKEMEAIMSFKGDVETIGTAEQFLVEVRNVPRFQEKLACLVFKQEFPSRVHELRESLDLVTRGVYQVCSSAELRQLFIYILQIGNLLNFGGDDEQQGVDAFSLGSLVKFSQTKAFVGGTTFLQYVVQSIERDVPHLAHFYKDIDLLSKCSKVAYASLASEKNALEAGLQRVLREAEASLPDDAANDVDKETMMAYYGTLMRFSKRAKTELDALQGLLDKLDAAKAHFLKYFEEEDTEEELDLLLSHIANFTSEYCREHDKYLAKMKKDKTNLQAKLSLSEDPVNTIEPKKETNVPHGKTHQGAKAAAKTEWPSQP